jgi:hypothetical protein
MAAHVSLPAFRSRPPIAKPPQRPQEIAAMDVAFALAVAFEAHALEAIVVLDAMHQVIASAGRGGPTRALTELAAGMTKGAPVGAFRSFDEGRVHLEIIALCGLPCVVALRGQVAIDDASGITSALQASFLTDDETSTSDDDDDADDDDDFDFDLGWGESPTDALRDVVG